MYSNVVKTNDTSILMGDVCNVFSNVLPANSRCLMRTGGGMFVDLQDQSDLPIEARVVEQVLKVM